MGDGKSGEETTGEETTGEVTTYSRIFDCLDILLLFERSSERKFDQVVASVSVVRFEHLTPFWKPQTLAIKIMLILI